MENQTKKKVIIFIFVMLVSAAAVFGFLKYRDSVKYKEYAGTYEMYAAYGSVSLNDYEYYRIILEADGDCIVESKGKGISQEIRATATYEIKDNKIYIYSNTYGIKVTEIYDYIDGDVPEIHMLNQQIQGYTINIKLKKVSD